MFQKCVSMFPLSTSTASREYYDRVTYYDVEITETYSQIAGNDMYIVKSKFMLSAEEIHGLGFGEGVILGNMFLDGIGNGYYRSSVTY